MQNFLSKVSRKRRTELLLPCQTAGRSNNHLKADVSSEKERNEKACTSCKTRKKRQIRAVIVSKVREDKLFKANGARQEMQMHANFKDRKQEQKEPFLDYSPLHTD